MSIVTVAKVIEGILEKGTKKVISYSNLSIENLEKDRDNSNTNMELVTVLVAAKIVSAALDEDYISVMINSELLIEVLIDQGDDRGARIIKRRLDGSYKDKNNIVVAD